MYRFVLNAQTLKNLLHRPACPVINLIKPDFIKWKVTHSHQFLISMVNPFNFSATQYHLLAVIGEGLKPLTIR